jgi:tetratricopeptide (TPR) repeat protein
MATGALAAVRPYDFTKIYPTEDAFMRSIKGYQDALEANPKDAEAAFWLGEAYWWASVQYSHGLVPYGEDYLDRSIEATEQAVEIDDKYIAAWQRLVVSYYTKGERERSREVALKMIDLALRDPSAANRGMPPSSPRRGEVAIKYLPLPDRSIKYNPAEFYVVGDPDSKLLYQYQCASLPAIKRPAFFLTKWEAFDRGYKPATVCPPL